MPYLRMTIDLAIPYPLAPNVQGKLTAIENILREWRDNYAVVINQGKPNQEDTKKAKKHICNHDIGTPCGTETDI